jgi:hypothetical protein
MALKRMFSLQIVDTDAFLDMPTTSQLLYFHLSMRADDDGFVGNPKKIIRMMGASDDDYKILVVKRFILIFESGVIVIKHWKINNYIQNDRYRETKYLEEKSGLIVKDNGSYTECIQGVSNMDSQIRLDKIRLDKTREYLSQLPEGDVKEFTTRFDASPRDIKNKAESLSLYCESRGKKYSNYKAFLLNALKKDFKERVRVVPKKDEPEITLTSEQKKQIELSKQQIRESMKIK